MGLILSTPMQELSYFDIVEGFPYDYMHGALMGVVKQLTVAIFYESTKADRFYLKRYGKNLDYLFYFKCKT